MATVLAASLFLGACDDTPKQKTPVRVDANAELSAHSEEFRKEVIKVTDGIYVAVGFGLANSIMLEGDDGIVIVDTMESNAGARAVKAEFEKITDKPVKAIVFTHNHTDHIFGSGVFAEDDTPDVYAHETTNHYIDRVVNIIQPAIYKRSMRQFGNHLPPGGVINDGIGPFLANVVGEDALSLARPTITFDKVLKTEVAGIKMELYHAPGETADQLFVWLPEKKVLLPGDNFYKAFPNLYAIRGTSYRDVLEWSKSLDMMRDMKPDFLVPSHSRPLSGAEKIDGILTDYRDAIQFIHDQTVRWINKDLGPDEIVERVKLPDHLANSPYLKEFYGMVDWSVRSVFTGYLGWFSGNATELHPLPKGERATRMAKLASSGTSLLDATKQALGDKDYQWAAELSDNLILVSENKEEAKGLKAQALKALAETQISANGRNYYLTRSYELDGTVSIPPIDPSKSPIKILHSLPVGNMMRAMPVNLRAEDALDENVVVAFTFPDINENYTIHLRRGVAEVRETLMENADITVTVNSLIWKEILSKRRNPAVAYAGGDIDVDGSLIDLVNFLKLFQPS
ncbi:MBL fold metallo-hydrolase [Sneathiella sp. P13V-1]|nr:MBL fold metallo-hydrolase [Sneathiella sp. P13V-1]